MTSIEFIDLMLERDIVCESESNNYFISNEFKRVQQEIYQELLKLNEKKIDNRFNSIFSTSLYSDNPGYIHEDKIMMLSYYKALDSFLENNNNKETTIRSICGIEILQNSSSKRSGDPDYFVPSNEKILRRIVRFFPKSVIYVWKDECRPCDLVKSDLEEIFAKDYKSISLFSMPGPENSKFLYEGYDIIGAPTLLLASYGDVIYRHQGAKYKSAIESDLNKLRDI
jgi:hypothetical protein